VIYRKWIVFNGRGLSTTNKKTGQCERSEIYIPMFHYMQVPQFHDLFLSLIDIGELLDLLSGVMKINKII